jgi:hypothetical protein
MESGVYEIICTVTGKRYVGSAKNFERRWKAHRFHLARGTHHSRHLQAAWVKHGEQAFSFGRLIVCAPKDAVQYEQIAIDALRPEFNLAPLAGSCLGVKHTAETREKQRAAKLGNTHTRGKKLSAEARANIGRGKIGNTHTKGKPRDPAAVAATAAAHRGMKRSTETRQKIAAKAIGRRWSEEAKAKVSESLTGRTLSEAHRQTLIGNKNAAGRKQTPEEKARRAASMRAAWAAKKAAGIPWR